MPKFIFTAFVTLLVATSAAFATLVDFTENFNADASGWLTGAFTPLNHIPAGGPAMDGSVEFSDTDGFTGLMDGDTTSLLRTTAASSGGAFFGDWLDPDCRVEHFQVDVFHDLPGPATFFARFATPANFPGTVEIAPVPVAPNTWTTLTFTLNEASPLVIPEGGPGNYNATFSNVGNIQVGVEVPTGLGGNTSTFSYQFDNASISVVPEPGTLGLAGFGVIFLALVRRFWK